MKTYSAKKDEVPREWILIDAKDQVVGRLASKIASILRGKTKPFYTPHIDVGDFVVVINADKVQFTGNKWDGKIYYRHSGYPGGIKATSAKDLLKKKPEQILKNAVKGMLPKGSLGNDMLKKLKVYTGGNHPHIAQQPREMKV
ncbi:MAG: 50S ribosomal protein L13 [Thermodesulfobacteriota bacterium]|nr:50S ribosomal protein L13 [Thermodesulfobacteriota bacterium]